MPSSEARSDKSVLPPNSKNSCNTHFFAFAPECRNGCTDGMFGVKGLSSDVGFLFKRGLEESPLPKAITKSLDGVVGDYEADKFLQIDYPAAEIQKAVMEAIMPLATVYIFSAPCLSAITSAVALCQCQESMVTKWLLRVDHRLSCNCCPDSLSGLARIERMSDSIADVESKNHWAKPFTLQVDWIDYIDRAWIEQQLYDEAFDGKDSKNGSSKSPSKVKGTKSGRDYAGICNMLTNSDCQRGKSTAVILADVENGAWILNSRPFPVVERQPRAGEMYKLKRVFEGGLETKEKRTFVGTFPAKGLLKRRRDDSPPTSTGSVDGDK